MTRVCRRTMVYMLVSLTVLTQAAHAVDSPPLRVCADPNNLPFSNRRAEGLENKLAELLAADLGRRVQYHWSAQRRGFIRNTLKAGVCDVLMGVPRELDMVLTTAPYYRSSYVFATRTQALHDLRSLDDPRLRTLRIGVPVVGDDYANPPPAHALARRGIVDNVVGFSVFGDYARESPPLDIVRALERGEIDVAMPWGPLAGFVAQEQRGSLHIVPVTPAKDGAYPFTFEISLGVRRDDLPLKQALEAALARQKKPIEKLLHAYGVPLL